MWTMIEILVKVEVEVGKMGVGEGEGDNVCGGSEEFEDEESIVGEGEMSDGFEDTEEGLVMCEARDGNVELIPTAFWPTVDFVVDLTIKVMI